MCAARISNRLEFVDVYTRTGFEANLEKLIPDPPLQDQLQTLIKKYNFLNIEKYVELCYAFVRNSNTQSHQLRRI
ncbi:MAG: hypothetical protein K0R57_5457 [Paenibacillaceae bacterium]|nr:hypothetical protein [Paenibacillaceae bacterium]